MESLSLYSLRLMCFFTLYSLADCVRTSNLVYYNVISNSTGMCFRRFNATHQIGCSSGRSGNVGVVHYAPDTESLKWATGAGPDPPYIVVIDAEFFQNHSEAIVSAGHGGRINGVVLLSSDTNQTHHLDSYSPDTQCPNSLSGAYVNDRKYSRCSEQRFNPLGNSLMFLNYPFPIVAVVNDSVEEFMLKQCYMKHNAPGPDLMLPAGLRCGMQIKDIMDGAVDTPTCIRRSNMVMNLSPQGYCDPIGSENIFSFIRPMNRSESKSVIMIAARLDAFSMFDGQYPGIDSAALSFITVFAVAEAIGRVKEQLSAVTDKHVMLVLFHGEAFDYIGSSRMVYDLQKDGMNFTVDDVEMFIEIGQLGLHSSDETVWMHTGLNETKQATHFKQLMKDAATGSINLSLKDVGPKQPLPPASFQSFLRARSDIPGVVLTNHQKEFANKFYNSMYDTLSKSGLEYPESLNETEKYSHVGRLAVHLQKVSTVVGRAVYRLVTGNESAPDKCSSSNVTVANLLYCLTVNPECELLQSLYMEKTLAALKDKKKFLSRYVGVYGSQSNYDTLNIVLFAHFLGDVVKDASKADCEENQKKWKGGYMYFYMQGPLNDSSADPSSRIPRCMRVAANKSAAVSPVFYEIHDYDWSSNQYSAWTESRWGSGDALSVRMFLMPSYHQQAVTFTVGVIVLLFSFMLVYFIERNASSLFTPESLASSST